MSGIVVYVAGGAMSAVFSLGVLHRLEALELSEIRAIYGVSAGALNAACFATNSSINALPWYTKIMSEEHIIKHQSFISVMRGVESLDMVRAEELLEQHEIVNIAALIKMPIPVYAKVLNATNNEITYIDLRRDDALHVLRASATLVPFTIEPTILAGQPYIDGAIGECIGIDRLRERHPGARFIVILNEPYSEYSMQRIMHWALLRSTNTTLATAYWVNTRNVIQEITELRASSDCFVFEPSAQYAVTCLTTNSDVLTAGFQEGCETTSKYLDALGVFLKPPAPDAVMERLSLELNIN